MSNLCDFEGILKTKCNLQHLTKHCRIKNLDDFERDEADAYLWRAGVLNVKKKEMTICYIMIIFQMDQQLKTKNISDVPGQLLCCKCKV